MQLIATALPAAAIVFAGVVLLVVSNREGKHTLAYGLPWLTWGGLGSLVVQSVQLSFYPAYQERSSLRQIAAGTWTPAKGLLGGDSDTAKLLAVRQQVLLLGLAGLEGTAFFGCIAYFVEAQPLALAAIAAAVALMLAHFPTEGRLRYWLDRRQQELIGLLQGSDLSGVA
jgi:hypothetical protein